MNSKNQPEKKEIKASIFFVAMKNVAHFTILLQKDKMNSFFKMNKFSNKKHN